MNISQMVQVATTVVSLIPVVVQLVNSVETAMPPGTPGAAKLEAVKTTLNAIYAAEPQVSATFDQVWPPISALITAMVAAYNAAGLFKKATA